MLNKMDAKTTEWIEEEFKTIKDNQEDIINNQKLIMKALKISENQDNEDILNESKLLLENLKWFKTKRIQK